MHKVLNEVAKRGCRVILVVPDWPKRPWTALLASFRRVRLGRACEVTTNPSPEHRAIASEATWNATELLAYLVDPSP